LIELNTIYNENCISENLNEGMNRIPDKSIDMILCDLPYGTTSCEWDTIIPFKPLWEQYERVIKDNGAIVLTGSQPFTSALVMSKPELFKYEWVWIKSHGGFANAKYAPLKRHEYVLIFGRGKVTYNPQMTSVEGRVRDKRKEPSFSKNGRNKTDSAVNPNAKMGYAKDYNPKLRYPKSILNYSNRVEKIMHPTQKPVALFEYLIKTYTNKGETVLDNCVGSGTTVIACINTKRKYLVFEQNKEIYKTAKKRIEAHTKQRRLF